MGAMFRYLDGDFYLRKRKICRKYKGNQYVYCPNPNIEKVILRLEQCQQCPQFQQQDGEYVICKTDRRWMQQKKQWM